MKKNKVIVVGNFSFGQEAFNGQTVKTRDYHHYLSQRFGNENVRALDTFNWKKHKLKIFFNLVKACAKNENVVLMLGINSAKIIVPLVTFLKKIFRFKIFFPVVGGGFMYEFDNHKRLKKSLSKVDAVLFETQMMVNVFREKGFTNIFYAPVFSRRKYNGELEILERTKPFKFCTYSRVCREKGITTAIDTVKKVNEYFGETVCTLDVFGEPYEDYKQEFEQKLKECEGFVFSKPYLKGDGVINTLSEYSLMLFPTYYEGEGFPIAIVECMLAGVPVIASDWHFNSEIVINNQTGYVYSLENKDEIVDIIIDLVKNPEKIYKLRQNCVENAKNFMPDNVLKEIYEMIEKGN